MVYEVDDLDGQGLAVQGQGLAGKATPGEDMATIAGQEQGLGQGHGLSVWSQLNTNRIPDSLRNLAGNDLPSPLPSLYVMLPPLCHVYINPTNIYIIYSTRAIFCFFGTDI